MVEQQSVKQPCDLGDLGHCGQWVNYTCLACYQRRCSQHIMRCSEPYLAICRVCLIDAFPSLNIKMKGIADLEISRASLLDAFPSLR